MKNLLLIVGIIVILGGGVACYALNAQPDFSFGATEVPVEYATDVVGSKNGTTTTGVLFGALSATTTYVTKIDPSIDSAIYNVKIVKASSTSQFINFEIFGSFDDYCDTATTSEDVGKPVLVKDINWFDLVSHKKGASQGSLTGTSSLAWTSPIAAQGSSIVLEDLNYRCLRLGVAGASTSVMVQLITK